VRYIKNMWTVIEKSSTLVLDMQGLTGELKKCSIKFFRRVVILHFFLFVKGGDYFCTRACAG
jgi:hypothetical protein